MGLLALWSSLSWNHSTEIQEEKGNTPTPESCPITGLSNQSQASL